MGDHLALLVDRLLTESTLTAALESRRKPKIGHTMLLSTASGSELIHKRVTVNGLPGGKLVECRICQEEDEDCNLEAPCACRGSLKFAHRRCIQQWCNEKGDTTCEICLEQFNPNYTAPSHVLHCGGFPINFRNGWDVSRREVHDSQIITMVPSDRRFVNSDFDYYTSFSTRSSIYCRFVAIIFMALLVLRHSLPIMISASDEHSFTLFMLLALGVAGILLPVLIMIRIITTLHCRQLYEATQVTISDESRSPEQLI